MRFKKLFAGLISATIIFFSSGTAFALYQGDLKTTPITSEMGEEQKICYKGFTGIVKEIREREGIEGSKLVSVENKEGAPANIVISNDTYILEDAEIAVGDTITAYYDANRPMIMIYPPQYSAEVVVVEKTGTKC
jgi:hypothetical protein